MSKHDIAQYLVNLHTLLQAQSSGGHSIPSAVLGAEYERNWALLKEEINNETRQSEQQHVRTEDRTEQSRGEHLERR